MITTKPNKLKVAETIWATPSESPLNLYPRDPSYYFEGISGSLVFLVGGYLFRVHPTIFAPQLEPAPKVVDCLSYLNLLVDPDELTIGTGISDADPVIVTDIRAQQFRHLLLALTGRPGDPEYMSLLADGEKDYRHSHATFIQYLDIATLASRLRMMNLFSWAVSQLTRHINSSCWTPDGTWDKTVVIQVAGLEKSTSETPEFIYSSFCSVPLRIFLRHVLDPSIRDPSDLCIPLYKIYQDYYDIEASPGLGIFGWMFAYVLSLGHQSPYWRELLTRDDRSILYMAQAELTNYVLSLGHQSPYWRELLTRDDRSILYMAQAELTNLATRPDICTDWLTNPLDPDYNILGRSCDDCSSHCKAVWELTYGQVGDLNSNEPLKDIRHLVRLPRYRIAFKNAVHGSWPCSNNCGIHVLNQIDWWSDTMGDDFYALYKHFVEHT
ncbi:unnamed protein product [Rhizoctonia solani]|uniref:Uncharacterized protein n=1 Tax=Rhizoctonia solani TaxID=456999 RepID=A0A8H2XBR5_9AGAM|nr:unnamed protein product [Rhizoctonia solani]